MTAPVEEDVATLARPADGSNEPRGGEPAAVDDLQDETQVRPWPDPLTLAVPTVLRDSRSVDKPSQPRPLRTYVRRSSAEEDDDSVTARSSPVGSYDDYETTQALAPPVSFSHRLPSSLELLSHADDSEENCTKVMPHAAFSERHADGLARTLESARPPVPSSVSGLATVRAEPAPASYASIGALMVDPPALASTERGRPPESVGRSPLALFRDGEGDFGKPPRYGLLVALSAAASLAVPVLLYLVLRHPPELVSHPDPSVPERDVQTMPEPRAKAISSSSAIRKTSAPTPKPVGGAKH